MKRQLLATLGAAITTTALAAEPQVPYPVGYRDWHHVKSMVIEEGHPLHSAFGGIHHIYANEAALEGYRKGHFPDGAILIFDLLDATHADNAITEGKRKVVGVMHKDAKQFATTGGWGFEGFGAGDPGNRVVGKDAASACFACHVPQAHRDYTFSELRD
ncbi:MAG: cytochrome P460 family protein [Rhodocyclaceae bacterium]|nr:cytochrome P460 family protein [Gammaproteobacteria bacterium]MCB1913953.1 cytochrome P460 family protein [Rhodocyclaceae bacterium]